MAVTAEDKATYVKLASLSAWEIADHFGCHYDGDSNPIEHGGFFYDTRDWESGGYASTVEFWWDDDADQLVVQRGTISKPQDLAACWNCAGTPDDPDLRNDTRAQIEAVKSYWGITPDGVTYPDLMNFRLDDWAEWRLWRSVAPWLKALGDSE